MSEQSKKEMQYAVIGLGRFGFSLMKTLAEYDANILAVDADVAHLHEAEEFATHVVQATVSEEGALEHLNLGEYDAVVVATGENFEATVLATMTAKEQGAKYVLVKAQSMFQKRILEKIGADTVVLPEVEMGASIARKLATGEDVAAQQQETPTKKLPG